MLCRFPLPLGGPRGGLILSRKEHFKAINKMNFPGIQGGPLMHVIAAKAVALGDTEGLVMSLLSESERAELLRYGEIDACCDIAGVGRVVGPK